MEPPHADDHRRTEAADTAWLSPLPPSSSPPSLDAEGSEIYFKPAADYVKTGSALDFYTVVEAATRRGHVAIGYRLHAQTRDAAHNYGVVINPAKSALLTFAAEDQIIVLARD